MKKFIIFFICVPLVYSDSHRFMTAYTGINGQTIAGTPEFSAVTTLDDQQIDYYDSNIKKLIPRQDWMKEFASTHTWREYTEIREKQQQIYRNNIRVLMERFSQSQGVHVYQRRYGCEYDNETGDSQGFDEYGHDGEDFISLDLKENRYITPVPQAIPTVMKWNNNRAQLKYLKQYYDYVCVFWLKELLHLYKATELPKVSLLQKKPDYYTCHVTGFLFRDTSISWRKNGQALSDYSTLVESGDTRPNGDGTFQRRLTLFILRDEWKKDRYTCVIEHKSWTEPIQKSMTVNKIKKKPGSAFDASSIMYLTLVIITAIVVLIVIWKLDSKMTTIYYKSKPLQEQAPAQDSLLSTPSNEDSSPPEDGLCESAAPPDSLRDEHDH